MSEFDRDLTLSSSHNADVEQLASTPGNRESDVVHRTLSGMLRRLSINNNSGNLSRRQRSNPLRMSTSLDGGILNASSENSDSLSRPNSNRPEQSSQGNNENHNATDGNAEAGTDNDARLRTEVTALLEKLHGVLPFVLLLVLRFFYVHAFGILFLVAATIVLVQTDNRLRAQSSTVRHSLVPARAIMVAMTALIYLWATYVLIRVIDEKVYLSRRLAILPFQDYEYTTLSDSSKINDASEDSKAVSLLDVLWIVTVSDLWTRLLTVCIKSIVAALPCVLCLKGGKLCCLGNRITYTSVPNDAQIGARLDLEEGEDTSGDNSGGPSNNTGLEAIQTQARKRKIFSAIELASLVHRTLMPVPVWYRFYMVDIGGEYFAAGYLIFKMLLVVSRGRLLLHALRSLTRGGLEHGQYCTKEEMDALSSPDCSICYETMVHPVKLDCEHVFCEVCLAEWLERERSCPLCRAETTATHQLPQEYRDGRTTIIPNIF